MVFDICLHPWRGNMVHSMASGSVVLSGTVCTLPRYNIKDINRKLDKYVDKFEVKILFTHRYKWRNFGLRLLSLVDRLYAVIHKTQKS